MAAAPDHTNALPDLKGRTVVLRRVQERDRRDQLEAGRDAEAVRMYGGDASRIAPFTEADAERWFQTLARHPHTWAIEVAGRCVGSVRLDAVNVAERRASFAIGIDDPARRGQGVGTEATRLVLRYAFEELALHRVSLRVLEYNLPAIACYERCGFVREGVERETVFVDGRWYGDVMMAILEDEFRAASSTWS